MTTGLQGSRLSLSPTGCKQIYPCPLRVRLLFISLPIPGAKHLAFAVSPKYKQPLRCTQRKETQWSPFRVTNFLPATPCKSLRCSSPLLSLLEETPQNELLHQTASFESNVRLHWLLCGVKSVHLWLRLKWMVSIAWKLFEK